MEAADGCRCGDKMSYRSNGVATVGVTGRGIWDSIVLVNAELTTAGGRIRRELDWGCEAAILGNRGSVVTSSTRLTVR